MKLTFNNDEKSKNQLIEELLHHEELDAFVQGSWLSGEATEAGTQKGCMYGCIMQSKESPINSFCEHYHIDYWFGHITEKIFEGLSVKEAKGFPLEAIRRLPVGISLELIKSEFHYRLLEDQLQYCKESQQVTNAVKQVMDLFYNDGQFIPFNEINKSAADSAESAAESAAWSAAESAAWSADSAAESAAWSADSAAESAAWSAADSARSAARSAAESAAWSAAESAAWSAAGKKHYTWMKELLFEILNKY